MSTAKSEYLHTSLRHGERRWVGLEPCTRTGMFPFYITVYQSTHLNSEVNTWVWNLAEVMKYASSAINYCVPVPDNFGLQRVFCGCNACNPFPLQVILKVTRQIKTVQSV